MGHPHLAVLKQILPFCNKTSQLNKNFVLQFCDACQQGKTHRQTIKASNNRASEPLELLHLDL